jgi:hypothetical protein
MRNPSTSDVIEQAPEPPAEPSSDERRQRLDEAVAATLAQPGTWRVESQSDYAAIVEKKTNHVLHLVLSVVTFGWWLPVWLIVAILNRGQKQVLTVDAYGNVSTEVEGRDVHPEGGRWRPTTRLGLWAVRLAVVWVVAALLALPFYYIPGGQWVTILVLYTVASTASVGSGVLALIAIIREKERAVSVYAALLPLLFLLLLLVLELTVGHD